MRVAKDLLMFIDKPSIQVDEPETANKATSESSQTHLSHMVPTVCRLPARVTSLGSYYTQAEFPAH